jgi:predicted dehydrogenase
MRHADGSLASITYATDGDSRFPKETLDVSGGGRNARLDNFTRATVWSRNGKDVKRSYAGQDKGQRAEVAAFVEAVLQGAPMPITLDSIALTTRATIAVGESLASGGPVVP